ncbi:MAG: iron chelate uptake ABC transporter family permease subunit [Clostridiales bacterium]|nr:iron chelate uptake ABC transporter family permease subunit [Clostridiales bacterium]
MNQRRKISILLISLVILIALFIVPGLKPNNYIYLLSRRIPKVIAILITAGSIALSSTVFQTVTNNRILTPSVLGLDSLYMLIQTIIIFMLGSSNVVVVNKNLNFLITVAMMLIFSNVLYRFLFRDEGHDIMNILLLGIIAGTLFQSLSSFMQMMIDPNEFLHVQDKMFASFNNINTNILILASLSVAGSIIYIYKTKEVLDVFLLGRAQAINLGVDYEKMVKKLLIVVSVLVSVSTALVGPITFLGLLAVNLAGEFLDTFKHKYLFITSALMASIALVGGQFAVERLFNFSTPISVIINFAGGIYFIYLLVKENLG